MSDNGNNVADRIFSDIKNTLLNLSEAGYDSVECSEKSLDLIRSWGLPKQNVQKRRVKSTHGSNEVLEALKKEFCNCQRCNLGQRRKNIVFGSGNPDARLLFIGEAPGAEEDNQGEPFVGPSGQLLTKMIQAMGLRREDVYICNVLKCRPPNNRNPLPEEILTCMGVLKRQLEIIRPEVICTLGGFAAQALLEKPDGITRLRGRFHDYCGIKLMPVFHPAYLLRNPDKKRDAWEDLKKVMALLGLQGNR